LNLEQAILICAASMVGGALNSVAGGGSFVTFPALLFVHVPPIQANATSNVALWMGAAASGRAYRNRLDVPRRILISFLIVSLIGGIFGAILLLKTPAHTFLKVLPWLTLGATLLFLFGKKLAGSRVSGVGQDASTLAISTAVLFQLMVGIYGGYFGGGMGIVMLAMLAALGMTDIHAMNALKSVMAFVINGVAAIAFVIARAVFWKQAAVMIVGGIIGGYLGAHYAQKVPALWIRWFVILAGTGMTIYFFVKAY
jgi:uncharacterized membrane protein YfcA